MALYNELTVGPLAAAIAPHLAARNDAKIAEILSASRTRLAPTKVGNLAVLKTLGIAAGNVLLDAIYLNATYRYVRPALESNNLDVSDPLVRATLDSLVPATITQVQADAIKNLALVPDPVTVDQVSAAIAGGV
jgi:hypothetical protein